MALEKSLPEKQLRRLVSNLGLAKKTLYGLRHAFGLRCADAGLPIHKLKAVMGHDKITTTEIYLKCEAREFREEFVARLAPSAPAG